MSRRIALASLLALLSATAGTAQRSQPALVGAARPAQTGTPAKGVVDQGDVGDFYYFDGSPYRLERSFVESVVRVRAGAAASVEAALAAVSTAARVVQQLTSSDRTYHVVRMPSGLQSAAGRPWVDELRAQPDVEFAAPVLLVPGTGRRMLLTDEIVVKLSPGTSLEVLDDLAAAQALRRVRAVPFTTDEFVLELAAPKTSDPLAISRALFESRLVVWAEPNFVQESRLHAAPNDPRFGQQWHLNNAGALGGTSGADVKAVAAWDIETGKATTVIAVIDDSVERTHEDLAANLFVNPGEVPGNGLDDDANTFVDDVSGWDFGSNDNDPSPTLTADDHGTAVAGVAAGRGNNSIGVSGACQNCRILPIRMAFGTGGSTDVAFANAIRYAATFADVINNSWSISGPSAAIQSAIQFAITSGRGGKGSVVLFAAGNDASALGLTSGTGLPAGTHRFRWTFSKDSSLNAGDDSAWLAWALFPGGQLDTFQSGALPAGWTTGGNLPWSVQTDPGRADEGMCHTRIARAGAITHSQSSYIEVVKTLPAGNFYSYDAVSAEAGFDGLRVEIDLNNNGSFDLGTGLMSGVPPVNQAVAYPARYPESIAVGASSDRDCRSAYSEFGPELAFVAPSSGGPLNAGIETTDRMGTVGYDSGNYTQAPLTGFSGTSSASPLAAGVAGLVISRNPALTRTQVLQILQTSADKVGPEPYASGRNNRYGYGRLNAHAALLATSTGGSPTAVNDSYSTPFNTPLVVVAPGVLGNDNPNGGGAMSAVLDTTVASGTLALSANGGFTYTPASGFSGPVTFTYHATNGNGSSNVATVTITVNASTAPTAANDSYSTSFNTALVVPPAGVLANDNANGGGAMTAVLVSGSANGTVNLSSNGGFTFTPTSGFSGQATFTYRAQHGGGQSNVATVTIAVAASGAPVAVNDSYTASFNFPLTILAPGVLQNDNPNGGGALSAVLVSQPANGTVSLSANGGFTFTPTTGFSGQTTFTYLAQNGGGPSNSATVTITVRPGLPAAVADTYSTPYGTTLTVPAPGVLANDKANGGFNLTAALTGSPAFGTVTLNADGSFVYVPQAGYSGSVTFSYEVSSSVGRGGGASVTITVGPPPPSSPGFSKHPVSRVVFEGQAARFSVGLTGVPLPTCTWQESTDFGATWTSTGVTATGLVVQNPTVSMSGTQYRCLAQNSQGSAASNPAVLSVAAIAGAAQSGTFAGQTSQALPTTLDVSGSAVTKFQYSWSEPVCNAFTVTSTVTGSIPITANKFSYTSGPSCTRGTFEGTFGTPTSVAGTITMTFTASSLPGCNCNGVAVYDWAADFGAPSAPQMLIHPTSQSVVSGQHVIFSAAAGGSPRPTFQWEMSTNGGATWSDVPSGSPFSGSTTPTLTILSSTASGYNGAQFRLRAQNASGTTRSNPAPLIVGPGQPPTAVADSYGTSGPATLNVAAPGVLANDASNGGGAMTAQLVTTTTKGVLTLSANGGFSYTPNGGSAGVDSFTYRAVNGVGGGNTTVVTITISPTNGPPKTNPDSYGTSAGVALAIDAPGVLANDDANGGSGMFAALVSGAANGAVSLNPNGSLTYTPNPGFIGIDSFKYHAVSSGISGNDATVTIDVTSGPVPPNNFRIVRMQGNAVTFAWTPPTSGPAPTGFQLEGGVLPGTTLGALPLGVAPSVTISLPSGAFFLRLKTIAGGQVSGPSNEIPANINVPVPPSAPSGLLGMVSGSAVQLAWTPTFLGGAPTGAVLDVTGTLSGSVPLGPGDTFSYPAMPPGTYTFTVRQTNAGGSSASSNAVTLSFPGGCSGAPQVPVGFLAYKDAGQLYLLWEPPAGGPAPSGYTLHVTGAFTGNFPMGSSRALTVPGPPGSYTFSVSAGNACGASAPTATQTVTFP